MVCNDKRSIRWISFQSLAGGMMIGAEQAFGCPPLFTIDYDGVANSDAYVYYMNEIRKTPLRQLKLNGNLLSGATEFISNEDAEYFNHYAHNIDVVVSVPICSGLSICTVKSARGGDAVRNDNMLNITKFVFEKINPKVFIFENAPALCSKSGNSVRDKLNKEAKNNGYCVTYVKTNSYLHFNVQSRERTFAIFWKDTKCPKLNYVNHPAGTILEYLSKISSTAKYNTKEYELFPDFDENGFIKYLRIKYGDDFTNHLNMSSLVSIANLIDQNNDFELAKSVMNERECKFMDHILYKKSHGKNYFDESPIYWGDSKVPVIFGRTYTRLIHPSGKRGYTVREFLKFMGMPDDYEFPNIMEHLEYIGQNVPVITARDWCLQIKDYLNGKTKSTFKTIDMFNNTKKQSSYTILG